MPVKKNVGQEGCRRAVIYVDHRENGSGIADMLSCLSADVRLKQLLVGDYVCSGRVCVERKSVNDFLASIFNQRIFGQLQALSEAFEKPVLIIEGDPGQLFSQRKIHANAIRGMLTAIAVDFGIPIIWTRDAEETAAQVFWIANREQLLEKKGPSIRPGQKARSVQRIQEYVVAGLPSVNSKLSRRLLKEFRSVRAVFNADEEKLMRVDKIGREKARRICELLNCEYSGSG